MGGRTIKGRKKTLLICAAVMAAALAALTGCSSKVAEYGKGSSEWFSRQETQPPATQVDDRSQDAQQPQGGQNNQGGQNDQGGQDSQGGQNNQGGQDFEKAQDALLEYINVDMVKLAEIEEKMIASYSSVSGNNYVDDATMYNEINNNTIPLCHELNNAVLEIVPTDREISNVHGIYRKYVTKYLNAMATIKSALENQDSGQVVAANDLISEANDLAIEFQQELLALAEERDIVFN